MKDDGGPAFPVKEYVDAKPGDITWGEHQGMSLRDWFAGMALAGCQRIMECGDDYFTSDTPEVVAEMAYKLAQAMLKERSKE